METSFGLSVLLGVDGLSKFSIVNLFSEIKELKDAESGICIW